MWNPKEKRFKKSTLNIHWKDSCWRWSSNTLATWCKELTHWKRPGCWESLKAGGEGDNRGRGGWMASLTQWTRIWASSGRWWRTGKPDVLQSMGSQTGGHGWVSEQQQQPNSALNFYTLKYIKKPPIPLHSLCYQPIQVSIISSQYSHKHLLNWSLWFQSCPPPVILNYSQLLCKNVNLIILLSCLKLFTKGLLIY